MKKLILIVGMMLICGVGRCEIEFWTYNTYDPGWNHTFGSLGTIQSFAKHGIKIYRQEFIDITNEFLEDYKPPKSLQNKYDELFLDYAKLKADYDDLFAQNRTSGLIALKKQNDILKERIKLLEEQLAEFIKIEPAKIKTEVPEPKFNRGDIVYMTTGGRWEIFSIIGYDGDWKYLIANNFSGGAFRNSKEVRESELIKIK